jgi:hypothetical protein
VIVAGPEVDDGFDEAEFVDEFGTDEPAAPWHNSPRAVIGASAAGIAVIGVLVAAVMFVSGGDEPAEPATFTDPSFSETAASTPATTTTATITSTPPLSTTEINGPPSPSPTTSGSSDTTTTSSGNEISSSAVPTFTRPRQHETEENPGGPTSRTRPRLNVTRTLGPG